MQENKQRRVHERVWMEGIRVRIIYLCYNLKIIKNTLTEILGLVIKCFLCIWIILFSFLFVSVCFCVSVCDCVCMWGVCVQSQVYEYMYLWTHENQNITLCLIPLRQVLSFNLELGWHSSGSPVILSPHSWWLSAFSMSSEDSNSFTYMPIARAPTYWAISSVSLFCEWIFVM